MDYKVKIVQPKNLSELWKIIPKLKEKHCYLAGGTDLLVLARRHQVSARLWVDLSQVKELKQIKLIKEYLFIGGRSTFRDLEKSALVKKWAPALFEAAALIASPPIRALATLGGNCANASPAGDGVAALYAEDARLVLENKGKRRTVPIEKFILGPRKTVLMPDELIVAFQIPLKNRARGAFRRLGPRRGLTISKVASAVKVEWRGKEGVGIRVALGAVGPKVILLKDEDLFSGGRALTDSVLKEIQKRVSAAAMPITDHRSTADYRRDMAGVLTRRALEKTREGIHV